MSFETATLDSLCELVVDCPHSTPKWTDEGIIVLRNQNIKNGVLDLSAPSFTNEEDYQKRIKRAAPKAGDIVFTREAPMGEVCMIPERLKCCLGQRQVLLRPKSDVNGQYLFWALQSPYVQQQIAWNEGTGSTVSNVRIPVLKALNIPRIGNEDMVAKSLSDIASKMALNTQTNQTLEQMAQAIFKSWFVDFDPVKAKMNGEQPEGMDAYTASLFPEKLVESELGLIPEGWEVLESQKVATVAIGKTPPRKEPQWFSENPENVTWISIKDMGNAGTYALDSSEYLTPEAVDKFNVKVIPDNTLILSFKLTVGRVAITHGEMTTNEAIAHYKLADDARVSTNFLYSYMKQFNFESLGSTSSIAKAVNSKIIKALPIIVPSKEILDSFDALVKPLFDKIKSNQMENQNLEALRDTLLPKLLSGEIELGTSEELVEAI